ncbi:MAG: hypothetical protein ABI091_29885, partial [Ferruginibacter sp.]
MTFKTIAATLLLTTLFNQHSMAQDITAASANDITVAKNEMAPVKYAALNTTVVMDISKAGNIRLSEKFTAMFPTALNQQWSNDNNGYWVSFNEEGRKKRAGFDNKLQLNYVITDCNLDQLSNEFRQFISKNYTEYQLLNAIEINAFGEQIQEAILQNDSTFITLKSTKDGIEEIKKINKA